MSQSQILPLWRTEREVLHWHLSHNATACSDDAGRLICVHACLRVCVCMWGVGGGWFLHKYILKEWNLSLFFIYGFNIELPINFLAINIKELSNTPAITVYNVLFTVKATVHFPAQEGHCHFLRNYLYIIMCYLWQSVMQLTIVSEIRL